LLRAKQVANSTFNVPSASYDNACLRMGRQFDARWEEKKVFRPAKHQVAQHEKSESARWMPRALKAAAKSSDALARDRSIVYNSSVLPKHHEREQPQNAGRRYVASGGVHNPPGMACPFQTRVRKCQREMPFWE
jgi:hypothetical protein